MPKPQTPETASQATPSVAKTRAQPESASLIDTTTLVFVALAVLGGGLSGWLHGSQAVLLAFEGLLATLMQVAPLICGGLAIAGLAQVLLPRDSVSHWLGAEAGLRGLLIAQIAGAITPGGPFASFALVYALGRVGADIGVLITYLTAWTTVSVMKLVVWEIPFLGLRFALFRFMLCLPMGIMAGLLGRYLAKRWGWTKTSMIVK
ncbi:MAG: hypothetical protein ABIH03_03015 [Pseudomonadota bacterium]